MASTVKRINRGTAGLGLINSPLLAVPGFISII